MATTIVKMVEIKPWFIPYDEWERIVALPVFSPEPGQYWDVIFWQEDRDYETWSYTIVPMFKAWETHRDFVDACNYGGSNQALIRRWIKQTCAHYKCTPRYILLSSLEEAKKWLSQ